MGKPTKVQNPHQSCHPQNAAPVKMLAMAHANVPTPKMQNGKINPMVRSHARTRANPGKKKEMAMATIIVMSSGMFLCYHRKKTLFTSSASELSREPARTPQDLLRSREVSIRSLIFSSHKSILKSKIQCIRTGFALLVVLLKLGSD